VACRAARLCRESRRWGIDVESRLFGNFAVRHSVQSRWRGGFERRADHRPVIRISISCPLLRVIF
jgi:hypothetical protein